MAPSKHKSRVTAKVGVASVGVAAVAGIAVVGFLRSNRGARSPYSPSQWRRACAASADGSLPLHEWAELLDIVSEKGCDLDAKREVWPALLGVIPPWVGSAQRNDLTAHLHASYEALVTDCQRKEEALLTLVVGSSRLLGTLQHASPSQGTPTAAQATEQIVVDADSVEVSGEARAEDLPGTPVASTPGRHASVGALPDRLLNHTRHASLGTPPWNGSWLLDLAGAQGGPEGLEAQLSPGRRSGASTGNRARGRSVLQPAVNGAGMSRHCRHRSHGTGVWGSSATLASELQGVLHHGSLDMDSLAATPTAHHSRAKHSQSAMTLIDSTGRPWTPAQPNSVPHQGGDCAVDFPEVCAGQQSTFSETASPCHPGQHATGVGADPPSANGYAATSEQPECDGEGPRFIDNGGGGGAASGVVEPGMWTEPWAGAMASEAHGGGGVEIPDELRHFWEAQRLIVVDAIRTDFQKHSLTTADAVSSWISAALVDNAIYQRYRPTDSDWAKGLWLSSLARSQLDHSSHFSGDQKRQVARLINMLSAYALRDPEVGYCQGMSDLALPFLLVMEDDALAFWCFASLMAKVRRNFSADDSGIFSQLGSLAGLLEAEDATLHYKLRQVGAIDCHFAYRMIVVLMRRELPLEQTLKLWEMLWADDWVCSHPAYTRPRPLPRARSVPLAPPAHGTASTPLPGPNQASPTDHGHQPSDGTGAPVQAQHDLASRAAPSTSAFASAAQHALAPGDFPEAMNAKGQAADSGSQTQVLSTAPLGDGGGLKLPGNVLNSSGETSSKLWSLSSWGVLKRNAPGQIEEAQPSTRSEPPTAPSTPPAAGVAGGSWLARLSRQPAAAAADPEAAASQLPAPADQGSAGATGGGWLAMLGGTWPPADVADSGAAAAAAAGPSSTGVAGEGWLTRLTSRPVSTTGADSTSQPAAATSAAEPHTTSTGGWLAKLTSRPSAATETETKPGSKPADDAAVSDAPSTSGAGWLAKLTSRPATAAAENPADQPATDAAAADAPTTTGASWLSKLTSRPAATAEANPGSASPESRPAASATPSAGPDTPLADAAPAATAGTGTDGSPSSSLMAKLTAFRAAFSAQPTAAASACPADKEQTFTSYGLEPAEVKGAQPVAVPADLVSASGNGLAADFLPPVHDQGDACGDGLTLSGEDGDNSSLAIVERAGAAPAATDVCTAQAVASEGQTDMSAADSTASLLSPQLNGNQHAHSFSQGLLAASLDKTNLQDKQQQENVSGEGVTELSVLTQAQGSLHTPAASHVQQSDCQGTSNTPANVQTQVQEGQAPASGDTHAAFSAPRALLSNLANLFSPNSKPPLPPQPTLNQTNGAYQSTTGAVSSTGEQASLIKDAPHEPVVAASGAGEAPGLDVGEFATATRTTSRRPPTHAASTGSIMRDSQTAVRWEAGTNEARLGMCRHSADGIVRVGEADDQAGSGDACATWGEATVSGPGESQSLGLFLYFVTAVVCSMRRRVLDDCHDADDVLRVFQQLAACKLDVAACMRKAREVRERRQAKGHSPTSA